MSKRKTTLIILFLFSSFSWASESKDVEREEVETKIKELGYFFNSKDNQRAESLKKAEYIVLNARKSGDPEVEFKAMSVVTYSQSVLGRYEDVKNNFENYYKKQKGLFPHATLSKVRYLASMAKISGYQEDYESTKEAIKEIERLKDNRKTQDPFIEATISQTLGEAYYMVGEYRASFQNLMIAKNMVDEVISFEGDKDNYLTKINSLIANLLFELEDYKSALVIYKDNYRKARRVSDHEQIGLNQYNIALVYTLLENWKEAKLFAKLSLSTSRQVEAHIYQGLSLELLALSERKLGNCDLALNTQNSAIESFRKMNNFEAELFSTIQLALIYFEKGDFGASKSTMVRIDSMLPHSSYDVSNDKDYLILKSNLEKHEGKYRDATETGEKLTAIIKEEIANSLRLAKTKREIHALKSALDTERKTKKKVVAKSRAEIFKATVLLIVFLILSFFIKKHLKKNNEGKDIQLPYPVEADSEFQRKVFLLLDEKKEKSIVCFGLLEVNFLGDVSEGNKTKLDLVVNRVLKNELRKTDLFSVHVETKTELFIDGDNEEDIVLIIERISSKLKKEIKRCLGDGSLIEIKSGVGFHCVEGRAERMNGISETLSEIEFRMDKNKLDEIVF